ncbi:MAG: transcription antitermination factor NusB [Acidobacteriota bacterium]
MKKKINRRILREKVLQILYAFEMNNEGLEALTEGILSDLEEETDKEFCRILVNKTLIHQTELDKKINERVNNWELNRIALIDKILLRMGLCELMYLPDIPPKVTINEVIEIAKNFSTPNSGKFINGILDTVLSGLRETGSLNKTGRGLIDETIQKKPKRNKADEE